VLDPNGAKGEGDEKGRRITLADASGKTLVDVIVGKEVQGRPGMFYVRLPAPEGQDDSGSLSRRVYGSRIELNVTTKFADWIEKDLLHVDRDEVVSVISDPYQVDEQRGAVVDRDPILAQRDPAASVASGTWTAEGTPDGKELDETKVRQMVTAIANIQIVGVRPRPEQLTLRDLQSKGFFVDEKARQLYGNEGQASIVTKDGLRYTLFFGEVTYESGLALTAGVEEKAAEGETKAEGEEATDDKTANRYMWLDVAYESTLDQTLSTRATEADAEGEDVAATEAAADPTKPTPSPEDEKKKLEGEERANKLARRFSQWYYVISDSSFKQVHKSRADLFKEKKAEATKPPAHDEP
jgi:hypothetical protein